MAKLGGFIIMDLSKLLADVNDFVWGPIMLGLLVGTGIFLTIRLRFLPWINLMYAIRMIFQQKREHEGDISPFQSLMTALSATVGTGNIVGVATAMVLGGPGALVWMWISAAFGLSTKYAESVLAVKYRETNSVGEMAGGPMYAMKNGIGNKFLGRTMAAAFAFFAVVSSFGIGNMTQANSISAALSASFAIPTWVTGVIIMAAQAEHGHGGVSFYNTFKNERDLRRMMARFLARAPEDTIVDQWQSQILARVLMKARVIFVSDCDDEMVRDLHMIPAHSLPGALALAIQMIGRDDWRATVIPDGVSVIVKPPVG